MMFRLINTRRAVELLRRHGATAALAALVIVGFAALAAIGTIERRGDEARVKTAAAEASRALLDREQRTLDQLARVAAGSADDATRRLLDQIPQLTPGVRAAAVYDPTGMSLLRSAGGAEDITLTAFGAAAAEQAATPHTAAMLMTPAVRDGTAGTELAGLARPWVGNDGKLAGIALIAVDRSVFGALRPDPDDAVPAGAISPTMRGAWPFVAIAVIGVTTVLSLLALLIGRLNEAEDRLAQYTALERELCDKLTVAAASADRSDELNRTKSRFFAQVTHELRTPLSAILGFSETIRQEMFGPVANARYLEYAGLIHDAGSHLLSLINDLLDNSRIEAGKMEIAPVRVAPAALARSALDLVELLAQDRDIAIVTSGIAACPDLNVDPRAIKQVLVNLLSNAIKYTPPGGRIDIGFAVRDDGGVAIETSDTGIGMSAEDLRVAFEPFGRANAVEARRQQGTGLGLSLARALVRLHGGDIILSSRLDAGTTATIVLPASIVLPATEPALPPKAELGKSPAQAA
jgi:signal transduction histidine kinase